MYKYICLCVSLSIYINCTVSHCSIGQRVSKKAKETCEQCPKKYYQPTENESTQCKVCRKCVKGTSHKMNIKHFEF